MNEEIWKRILSYIDDHIREKIDLAVLAELAGYSPFYFSRLFSETMGIPPLRHPTQSSSVFPFSAPFPHKENFEKTTCVSGNTVLYYKPYFCAQFFTDP